LEIGGWAQESLKIYKTINEEKRGEELLAKED